MIRNPIWLRGTTFHDFVLAQLKGRHSIYNTQWCTALAIVTYGFISQDFERLSPQKKTSPPSSVSIYVLCTKMEGGCPVHNGRRQFVVPSEKVIYDDLGLALPCTPDKNLPRKLALMHRGQRGCRIIISCCMHSFSGQSLA